jgi:hypothetical protein
MKVSTVDTIIQVVKTCHHLSYLSRLNLWSVAPWLSKTTYIIRFSCVWPAYNTCLWGNSIIACTASLFFRSLTAHDLFPSVKFFLKGWNFQCAEEVKAAENIGYSKRPPGVLPAVLWPQKKCVTAYCSSVCTVKLAWW